jgi:hypothetical protein
MAYFSSVVLLLSLRNHKSKRTPKRIEILNTINNIIDMYPTIPNSSTTSSAFSKALMSESHPGCEVGLCASGLHRHKVVGDDMSVVRTDTPRRSLVDLPDVPRAVNSRRGESWSLAEAQMGAPVTPSPPRKGSYVTLFLWREPRFSLFRI